jgi:putative peptidoglycan binding protein
MTRQLRIYRDREITKTSPVCIRVEPRSYRELIWTLVQQSLEERGYDPGRSDGIADDSTRQAIRDFQRDKELPMTGVVDERTAENLSLNWRSRSDERGESALRSPFS